MRRRDISLTVALCVSLTAHAVLSRALADRFVASHRQIYLAGIPNEALAEDHLVQSLVRPPALEFDLGNPDGHGTAIDAMPGEAPMQARQADQDQPLARIDPPGANTPLPSQSSLEEAVQVQQALVVSAPAIPFGMIQKPTELVGPAPKHVPAPNALSVAAQLAPVAAHEAAASASANSGEPAPQLDSEADAFTKEGSVKFRQGKTDVQFGRQHKLIRPRFDLAVQQDLQTMRLPITLVLKLKLDHSGNVAAADVETSSGSKLLDHAVKVTAFKWWFEPKKAKDASADEFLFTIRFL